MRQIVLDTETTGLEPSQGHRIIEIGCVELVNRRLTDNRYHQYINPEREIDEGAVEVHGITTAFLADKPRFDEIAADFINFIDGAELIIHNAPFDVGFINHELKRLEGERAPLERLCRIIDTLVMARQMHPGQKNNLDALCKRYTIDNASRELHGALLDAEILAEVYLAMTGGQVRLSLEGRDSSGSESRVEARRPMAAGRPPLKIIPASEAELRAHQARLEAIDAASDGQCLWRKSDS
ncbi:DNA polymerase III subunit epsilon [Thiohalophilus thiocyanatoxydans]|uniref:DNA polymerase III subunit epsilon n=1 Tax=Thiohalophilus thiocyanatoxydans TaxID=381308 RepID=A0A4R8IHK2_9GAMM|nr:DNA polymerase III subunit epsilon [Thiohalophilus thiocyanatoxydans]TDY00086.1 DNA polymerase-3 subunit epsilon [Thiohalophilus thiocyanatoxydans]